MNIPPHAAVSEAPGSAPGDAHCQAMSVSELNRCARRLLEKQLPACWIEGEISSLSRPASGHAYFTLKDAHAQIRCALFRQQARFVAAPLREGAQVQVRAQVSLYEPRGDYQLIVEAVRAVGHGALLQALEALRTRLNEGGLFNNARPLPYPPRHLGLITSATGAAIQDVMAVLAARWPGLAVSLIPVPVQGQQAPDAIVQALYAAYRDGRFDTLLLTRGGGSFEDLNVFNDERIVRALHVSPVPVLSAIGHDIDTTLADLAADAAAPTPSAAAERLVPDQRDLRRQLVQLAHRLLNAQRHTQRTARQRLDQLFLRLRDPRERLRHQREQLTVLTRRLWQAEDARVERLRQRLILLEARLRSPLALLAGQRQALTALWQRLVHAHQQCLRQQRQRLWRAHQRLQHILARRPLHSFQPPLDILTTRLKQAQQRRITAHQQRCSELMQRLDSVSPLNTLRRGYAVVRDGAHIVTRAHDVSAGQALEVVLEQGRLNVEVKRCFNV